MHHITSHGRQETMRRLSSLVFVDAFSLVSLSLVSYVARIACLCFSNHSRKSQLQQKWFHYAHSYRKSMCLRVCQCVCVFS